MLNLHFSNRQEALADLLCAALGQPGGNLFTAAEVIVPSMAMRRAITLQMARQFGVCANLRFGFLAQWLWATGARVLAAGMGATPSTLAAGTIQSPQAPWQPALLAWRVLAAFDDPGWVSQHARLARWLAQADAVSRLDLAQRVAGQLDQAITYRPDWLAAWAVGRSALPASAATAAAGRDDEAWQAALWRRLQSDIQRDADTQNTQATVGIDPSAAHTLAAALAQLDASPATVQRLHQAGLPAVAHVFCLPSMAPVHLALLQQLARWADVHVYATNPCAEYWFDVVKPRRLAALAARFGPGQAQHLETGNRLLAAWGQQTQAHLAALVDASGDGVVDDAHFMPNPGGNLLAAVQNSILHLHELAPASLPLQAHDHSITLHVCHSLTRELEVLHNTLLALMCQPDPPAPGDILVAVPDLQAAVPLIDSVFGTAPPERALPFTITGRAPSQANPAARALLDLLALVASRCTAAALFGLLQQPVVAARFGLDDEGLARVHGWLLDAGVHWALDGGQRAALGLDADPRHSLADGLERLFLGHALPAAAAPINGRLPVGHAEGSAALPLGALWQFAQALSACRQRVASALPAQDWPGVLGAWTDAFVQPGVAGAAALADLRAAVATLAAAWQQTTPTLPLALDVVRQALTQALDDPARGGVPSGRISFAAYSSLRGLPYRVVCLLGLDDGIFPSSSRPAEFDLMALHPRPGDRQRRDDERGLFLDLLLAARERLHLSHTGRSVRDNSPMPPSVLVAELLDVLVPALDATPAAALAHLVVQHPLQAFDPRAFQPDADPRLRSFQQEYALALAAGQAAAGLALPAAAVNDRDSDGGDDSGDDSGENSDSTETSGNDNDASGEAAGDDDDDANSSSAIAAPAFFRRPLPAPTETDLTLAELQRFFRHPARWLLQQRLGLALPRADEQLSDDEPFLPDHAARQALARQLLPVLLLAQASGEALDNSTLLALAGAGTSLPAGAIGERFVHNELPLLRGFATTLAEATAAPLLPTHSATLHIAMPPGGATATVAATVALAVSLPGLRAGGLVLQRYDTPRPADHLDAWLAHLALCASAPAGVATRTVWLGREARFGLRSVADPLPLLQQLLALFAQGQQTPLYFFPKTAWAWLDKGRSLAAARGAWLASARKPFAEQADAANALALRGLPDPLVGGTDTGLASFEATSLAVLQPLFDHLDDGGET